MVERFISNLFAGGKSVKRPALQAGDRFARSVLVRMFKNSEKAACIVIRSSKGPKPE